MIALIQRTTSASVTVAGQTIASISGGLLALVAVEKRDTLPQARRLADRLVGYRVFSDAEGRMNLSLADVAGELLIVPQFTLAADTAKGMRPSFAPAADPELGQMLIESLVEECRRRLPSGKTAWGRFGADMKVALINDGPVTFLLRAPPHPIT